MIVKKKYDSELCYARDLKVMKERGWKVNDVVMHCDKIDVTYSNSAEEYEPPEVRKSF